MLVQRYSYGGFLNLHKYLSNANINIIQEISTKNSVSNLVAKLREFRKYKENVYEMFTNSCSSFVEKLYTETYLNIDKSLMQINELLIKEVKYLLLTKSDMITDEAKVKEENFKKNLVDKLYDEFLQQEKSEKDENTLLYFNKINMAHKFRKFLNLYSIDDPEASEIILSLIQIDTSKVRVDHKSVLKSFDDILNSSKPHVFLKSFFSGNEQVINDSFLRTYWMCLKNLHQYFRSYNSHVLSILGEDFKNVIFKYLDDVICNNNEKIIHNDQANYFLNIHHFFDTFITLIISKVHNSKVTILNENGILISIRINTLPDKTIQLVSTKYYSGTLIPHRVFDDVTYLLVHEDFPILEHLQNFEITSINADGASVNSSDNKYTLMNESMKIFSVTSQENEEIKKCIKEEVHQTSKKKERTNSRYYKSVGDILAAYNGRKNITENDIYLLLLNMIRGNLTNLSLLFSLEIINYLDEYCEDVELEDEELVDIDSGDDNKKERKNRTYNNDFGYNFPNSDKHELEEDNLYIGSMENISYNQFYENPKLKVLYDSISNISGSANADVSNLKGTTTIPTLSSDEMNFKMMSSLHSSNYNASHPDMKKMFSPYEESHGTSLPNLSSLSSITQGSSRENMSDSTVDASDLSRSSSSLSLNSSPDFPTTNMVEWATDSARKTVSNEGLEQDGEYLSDWSMQDEDENNAGESKSAGSSFPSSVSGIGSSLSGETTPSEQIDYTTAGSSTDSFHNEVKEEQLADKATSNFHPMLNVSENRTMSNTTESLTEGEDPYDSKNGLNWKDAEKFSTHNISNLRSDKNNDSTNEQENYERNNKEITSSAWYLRSICRKKKIMEKEKLKSVKELRNDLLRTKYSVFNKIVLFLNEANLKNIFESTFFDSIQMKNAIIRIMSSYEIDNLTNILNVNMSDLNNHFFHLRNIYLNKEKILSFFNLNTSQNVFSKIESKFYSVFTTVWFHYTNYLFKILDIFGVSELRLLSSMYHSLVVRNKDENHLSLLNYFGFTDVFMVYLLLIRLRRNVYYINQNKAFHVHNGSSLKVDPLYIARGNNGYFYVFKNNCGVKILSSNLDNKNKIDAGFGLHFYVIKNIDKSIFSANHWTEYDLEGETKLSLAKKSISSLLESIDHGSIYYNINDNKDTQKYSFLSIYRNENASNINDLPALITAIICGQLYDINLVKECIRKDEVFFSFTNKMNSIVYNFYNNSTSFKNVTFISSKQSYENAFSDFYNNEKILLGALLLYLDGMKQDVARLSTENEIRYNFSFVYNLIKMHILKKSVSTYKTQSQLYALEEIMFKYKLYSEKIANALTLLNDLNRGNSELIEILDTMSLIFYRMKVEDLGHAIGQGIPEVHAEILILDLMDVINIVAFFHKVLNKIETVRELEDLIDKEKVIKLHIEEIIQVVKNIFESYDNYYYDIIGDDIKNTIKETLLKKMKNLFINYKRFINEESKKLSSKFIKNLTKKKSFFLFEGPVTYNFPIDISYGKVKNFEQIFFLDLIEYSYSDYTSSHLKYAHEKDEDEGNNSMSKLIERVKKISLLYHAFDIPKEYNEKLFDHIFEFSQKGSVNKSFVQRSKLWGRDVTEESYTKLCIVNLQRRLRYYFESSRIHKLVDFMLKYNEIKIGIKKPVKEGKGSTNLYLCIKDQWFYKHSFQNMKSYLSNIRMKFNFNVEDIKMCAKHNSGYPHLNTLTHAMLNILAYELHNIFNKAEKFDSMFSLMNVKNTDISSKLIFQINNVLNMKQKICIFYYSKNTLLHVTEILSQHFKERIIYMSDNMKGGYDVYSFNPARKEGGNKIIILKEGHTFKVYNHSSTLFSHEMHHLRDTSTLHIYYEELVKLKKYLEALESEYTDNPNTSVEDIHTAIRGHNTEKNYTNIQQMILTLIERKDVGNRKKVILRNIIDLDIVKHRNKRVKNNYLHLLYLEVFSLFGFGPYSDLDNLLKDLFLCDKGLLEWFQLSLSEVRKGANDEDNYSKLRMFVSALRYMIKKLDNILSKNMLEKHELENAIEFFKKKKDDIIPFDFENFIPHFLKKKKKKLKYNTFGNKIEEFKIDEKVKDQILAEIEQYKFSIPSDNMKPYYFISLIGLGYSYIQKFNELKLGLHSSVSSSNVITLSKLFNLFYVNELTDVINLIVQIIMNVYMNFFYKSKNFIKDQNINLTKEKKKRFGEMILSKESVNIDPLDTTKDQSSNESTEKLNNSTESFTVHEYYINYVIKNAYDFFYTVFKCSDDNPCFVEKGESAEETVKKYLRENSFNQNMIWLIPILSNHFRSSISILYMNDKDIRLYKYQDDSAMKFSIQILVQEGEMFLVLPTYFIHMNILSIITNTLIKNENDATHNERSLSPLYSKVSGCVLILDESIKSTINSDNYYKTYFEIIEEKINLFLQKKMHIYSLLVSIKEDILNFKYFIYYENFVKFLKLMDYFISVLNSKLQLNVDFTFEDIFNSPNTLVKHSINNIINFIVKDNYKIFGTEIKRFYTNIFKIHVHERYQSSSFLRLLDFLLSNIKTEIDTQNKQIEMSFNFIENMRKRNYVQNLKTLESLIICEQVKIISNIMKYIEINLDNIINHIVYKSEKIIVEHEMINKVQIIHDCCLKYDFNELGATELTKKYFKELEEKNIKISNYSKILQKLSDEELDYEDWYSIASKIQVDYFKKNELVYFKFLKESTFWKHGAKYVTEEIVQKKLKENKLYIEEKDVKLLSNNKVTYSEYKDLLFDVKIISMTEKDLDAMLVNREQYAISIVWKFFNTEICVNGNDIPFEDIYAKLKNYRKDLNYLSLLKKEDVYNLFNAIVIFHRLVESIDEQTFNKYKSYRITNILFDELMKRGVYISGDSLITKEYIESIFNYDMWRRDIKHVKVSNILIRSLVPTKYINYYSTAPIFKILRFFVNSKLNVRLVNVFSYVIYNILKLGNAKDDIFKIIMTEGLLLGSLDVIKLILIKLNISLDGLTTAFTALLTNMYFVLEYGVVQDIIESIDYRRMFSNLFFLLHNLVEEFYFKAILNFLLEYPFIVDFIKKNEEKIKEILINFKRFFLLNFGTYVNFFQHLYDSIETKFLTYIKYYATKILNNFLPFSSDLIEKITQIEMQRISLLEFISFRDEESIIPIYQNIIAVLQDEDFMVDLRISTINKHKEYFSSEKNLKISEAEFLDALYNKYQELYQSNGPSHSGLSKATTSKAVPSKVKRSSFLQKKTLHLKKKNNKRLLKGAQSRFGNVPPPLVNHLPGDNTSTTDGSASTMDAKKVVNFSLWDNPLKGNPSNGRLSHIFTNKKWTRSSKSEKGEQNKTDVPGSATGEKEQHKKKKKMNEENKSKESFTNMRTDHTQNISEASFFEKKNKNTVKNYYLIESNRYRTLSCLEKMFLHSFDSNSNFGENKTKICSSLYSQNWTKKLRSVSMKKLSNKSVYTYGYTHDLILSTKVKGEKCEVHFKLNIAHDNKQSLKNQKYKNAIVDFNIFRENNELCFLIVNSRKSRDKNVFVCYHAEMVPFYRTYDLSNYLNDVFSDVDSDSRNRMNEENQEANEKDKINTNEMYKYPFNIIASEEAGESNEGRKDIETRGINSDESPHVEGFRGGEKKGRKKTTDKSPQGKKKDMKDEYSTPFKNDQLSVKINTSRKKIGALTNTFNDTFKNIRSGINKIKDKVKGKRKGEEEIDDSNDNIGKIKDALKYLTEKKIINQLLEFEYFHSTRWNSNIFSVTIDNMKGSNENIMLVLEVGDYNLKTYYEVDIKNVPNVQALQKLDYFIKKSNVTDMIAQRLKKYTKLNFILKHIFRFNHEIKNVSYIRSKVAAENVAEPTGSSQSGKENHHSGSLTSDKHLKGDGSDENDEDDDDSDEGEDREVDVKEKSVHGRDSEQPFQEYIKFTWYKEHKKERVEAILAVKAINPLNLKNHNSEILCETDLDIRNVFKVFKPRKKVEGSEGEGMEINEDETEGGMEQSKENTAAETTVKKFTSELISKTDVEQRRDKTKEKFFTDYATYFSKIYPLTDEENYFIKTRMQKNCALLKYRLILLSVIIIKSNNLSNLKKMSSLSNQYLRDNYRDYKNIEFHQNKLFRKKYVYIDNKHYIIKKKLECLIGLDFYKSLRTSLEKKNILQNFLEDLTVEISNINRFFYKYYYNDNSNIHSSSFYLDKLKNIKFLCPVIYDLKNKEKIDITDTSKVDTSIKLPNTKEVENEIEQCERRVGFYGSNILSFGKELDDSIGKKRIENIAMFSYECEKSIFNEKNLSELDEYHRNFCVNVFENELEERDEQFRPNTEWIDMLYNTFSSKKNHNYTGKNFSEIRCFGFADRDELKEYQKKKEAKCKVTILNRTLNVLQQFMDKYYAIKKDGINNGNAYNVYALFKNIYTVMIYKLMYESRPFKPLRVQQKLSFVGNKYTKLLYKKENYSKFLKNMLDKSSTLYLEIELLYNEHVFLRNISFPLESVDILMFNHKPFSDEAYGYRLLANPNENINEGEENTKVYSFFVLILLGYYPEIQKSLLEVAENSDLIYKLLDINVEEVRRIIEANENGNDQENGRNGSPSSSWGSTSLDNGTSSNLNQMDRSQSGFADKLANPLGTLYNFIFSKTEDANSGSSNTSTSSMVDSAWSSPWFSLEYPSVSPTGDPTSTSNEASSTPSSINTYEINDFTWMEKEQIDSVKRLIVQHELVDYFIKGIKLMNLNSYLRSDNYLDAFKKALNDELKKKNFYHHFIKTSPLFHFDFYKVHHLLLFAFYYAFSDIIRTRRQYVNLESSINRIIDNNKSVYIYRTQTYKNFNLDPEKRGSLNKDHEEIAKFIYNRAIQYRYINREKSEHVLFTFSAEQIDELMIILNNKKKQIYTANDLEEITAFVEVMVENYIYILNNYPSNFSISKHSSFYKNFIRNAKQYFFSYNKKNNLLYIINQRDVNYNIQTIKHLNEKSTVINLIKSVLEFVFLASTRSYTVDRAIKEIISINEQPTLKRGPHMKHFKKVNILPGKYHRYAFLQSTNGSKTLDKTKFHTANPTLVKMELHTEEDNLDTTPINLMKKSDKRSGCCRCCKKKCLTIHKRNNPNMRMNNYPMVSGVKEKRGVCGPPCKLKGNFMEATPKVTIVNPKKGGTPGKRLPWNNAIHTFCDKKGRKIIYMGNREEVEKRPFQLGCAKRGDTHNYASVRSPRVCLKGATCNDEVDHGGEYYGEVEYGDDYYGEVENGSDYYGQVENGSDYNGQVENGSDYNGQVENGSDYNGQVCHDEEHKTQLPDTLAIARAIEYNFTEHEHNKDSDSSILESLFGSRMNNMYSKLKGGVFSFAFSHGFDFFLRNSLYFYKKNLISRYITHYAKTNVVQSLDMLFLIVRDHELKTSITNTYSIKHNLFDICLFNFQNLSISLKNILNMIDEDKIEKILSYVIAEIHMRYTGNARFIENMIKNLNNALSKNITLKKLFGNFISYLTISSIQTIQLYFHSRYKKKLLKMIITIMNKISGTISNVFGEPFFQSYMCMHLIKLGESFIREFNAENTVYRFFMDVGEINFIDIIISYAYKYFPKAVHDFMGN
ncbi:conserved Plasmodium protein, unknown function [Plasmodium knowlesi strain H]|uniref:Uncharacterized protein n=3 Tax=Plasmodium knowlesi TaxID=5850 RepID=A0A5E7WZ63_PLAKH|nr:conserved Plasmodium protein, unknown function [Plasmodium knowlesi strain H]OTN65099.1 Uncharacterized protein PKNOH_S120129000 [Plasmodium knowlesi]CAA9988153.1 conserved Plasmodium protein, unknown function [Plasmodium knowlesi strain H]SBO20052.1 conserved Plasmodium protein, unknown function [Plasmodium knowlesi strain H]SBO20773.1 conserved Plasmodium protein, unknown function [Plasmodium knowlesi strain H]VVS77627.1 conserved Plasmodium protein, unknown function [Plasmodium knowlesi 